MAVSGADSLCCEDDDDDCALTAPSPGPSFVMLGFVGLALYLVSGVAIYAAEKGAFKTGGTTSTIADGLYFSVVTLCTIGYGDIVPRTNFVKLFICTFVLFGFGFVYVLLNGLVAHVLDRQEQALLGMVRAGERPAALHKYVMDVKKGRVRVRLKVGLAVGVVVGCIAVGAAMARLLEGLGWVDSLYLAVTSVTTVGYGDVAFATAGGRVFATVWLLVSTLAVARAFLYLTELRMEKRNRKVARWVLHKKMTSSDMVAADLDRDGYIRYARSSLDISSTPLGL
ncbi:hypothetical protein Taro_004413 [Colocasia esculenta]|uniref:Potassium channel domain-containing protein n=1 Tax=Colocasia esculenta TaxID=4460 RepID=A0A843TRM4_COLES|nr:hypothetical protein [Colocasia esculenta]